MNIFDGAALLIIIKLVGLICYDFLERLLTSNVDSKLLVMFES